MKIATPHKTALAAAAVFVFAIQMTSPSLRAGDTPPDDSKDTTTVTAPPEQPWHLELAVPSWLAASSGTVGADGNNTHVYTSFDTLLRHLDMTAAFSANIRYDRFGFYGDFLYANASQTTVSDGLIDKVSGGLSQWIANMEMSYRVIQSERWALDLRAGARYTTIFTNVNIYPNDGAIDRASAQFVQNAGARFRTTLESRLNKALDGQNISLPIPPLAAGQRPRIDAALNSARSDIASALKRDLNRSLTLSEDWWDPYVGIGGRYNLNDKFYLTGKADIGGFTVGSQITWQAYGGLGYHLTKSIFAEIGYHYLYTNYRSTGFEYDISQSGIQITGGITF